MKNLANCKPSEFLVQTSKIRKSAANWLAVTDVMNIRKTQPFLRDDMTKEERKKAFEDQAKKNLTSMLDAILDSHPQETLELIALCCFVDPENVDDYSVSEYLLSFTELINDEAVLGFFTSLMQLVQKSTLTA